MVSHKFFQIAMHQWIYCVIILKMLFDRLYQVISGLDTPKYTKWNFSVSEISPTSWDMKYVENHWLSGSDNISKLKPKFESIKKEKHKSVWARKQLKSRMVPIRKLRKTLRRILPSFIVTNYIENQSHDWIGYVINYASFGATPTHQELTYSTVNMCFFVILFQMSNFF